MCTSLVEAQLGHRQTGRQCLWFFSKFKAQPVFWPHWAPRHLSLSVLVLSVPSFGYGEVWFHHLLPQVFSVTVLFVPKGPPHGGVFVFLTNGIVSIESSFQRGREEALGFLSHNQMRYLHFYLFSGIRHKHNVIERSSIRGLRMEWMCVCWDRAWHNS